jgi:acyl carrier protein
VDPRLRDLIAEILDLDPAQVVAHMRRSDTEAWDSLTHLRLVTAIESAFGAKFTMDEIANLQTPAELQRTLARCGVAVTVD